MKKHRPRRLDAAAAIVAIVAIFLQSVLPAVHHHQIDDGAPPREDASRLTVIHHSSDAGETLRFGELQQHETDSPAASHHNEGDHRGQRGHDNDDDDDCAICHLIAKIRFAAALPPVPATGEILALVNQITPAPSRPGVAAPISCLLTRGPPTV